jgi:hypothetical protein
MIAYPNVELSVQRLLRFGWKTGDVSFDGPEGREWLVTGQRGKHWIVARGPSQAAAWWLAWKQANQLEVERTVPARRRRKSAS